jgi:Domain of unknown function (DUF4395)
VKLTGTINHYRFKAWTPKSVRCTNCKPNSERTLKMARLSVLTETNLDNQGFGKLDKDTKSRVALPLRFTPAVGTALIGIGLIFQSPMWLGSMALVAFSGALLPDAMVIDLVYNFGVRHLFRAPPLPSTPKPRQFSYLLSTVLLSGSAVSFYYGLSVFGLVLGGLVVAGGTILTTTLWCLGSWYYRMIFGHARAHSGIHAENLPHNPIG